MFQKYLSEMLSRANRLLRKPTILFVLLFYHFIFIFWSRLERPLLVWLLFEAGYFASF